jgi:glycogen debranching enzyme
MAETPAVSRKKRLRRRRAPAVLKVGSDFYLLASSLASRRPTRMLCCAKSFAIFDAAADIPQAPLEALGFFHDDTRYLSHLEFRIAGKAPHLLNSYVTHDYSELCANLTNTDLHSRTGAIKLARDSIQVDRRWALDGPLLLHCLRIRNFSPSPISIPMQIDFGVDFADLFEVRGVKRARRGTLLAPQHTDSTVKLAYHGLDGVTRQTEIHFEPKLSAITPGRALFTLDLKPEESRELEIRIVARRNHPPAALPLSRDAPHVKSSANFDQVLAARRSEIAAINGEWAQLTVGNPSLDELMARSKSDLVAMFARTGEGAFVMAGIPWFATLFGRDSLITALSILPFSPHLAVDTLRALATLQGSEINQGRDEEPGKIVHEVRNGEMAATGEVPFGRYYGSVDSTPLFLWLYGECIDTTGDLELAEELWPHAMRGLEWIERWGDRDGDGYVEYLKTTPKGLANQGWKDSWDSVSHRDGELARPPIALAEVQGYVYAAYITLAAVAEKLNHPDIHARLLERAETLRKAFSRDFWLEPEGIVALALDCDKKPCRVMASNAAHCLAAGLLDSSQAAELSQHLMADDMFSGWGLRTLSARERRYNPMSYHNGSVWPHDNALAAKGLARYGNYAGATRILNGLLDAGVSLHQGSLPELFCGFTREEGIPPVPYPVACHPQAWSASAFHMLLQAVLGLKVLGADHQIKLSAASLPEHLDPLKFDKLTVGRDTVSFTLHRKPRGETGLEIVRKPDAVSIGLLRSELIP